MKIQSTFLKNSAYDKQPMYDEDGNFVKHEVPMFRGTVDIKGKIYDGLIYIGAGDWGKEIMLLCLENSEDQPLF